MTVSELYDQNRHSGNQARPLNSGRATSCTNFALVVPVPGRPEVPARVSRLGQDAGIVSAVGQHERHVGIGQEVELEHRAPRRNVVLFGSEGEDGNANVVDGNRAPVHLEAALRKIVVEVDGRQHADSNTDRIRDAYLRREGYQVLRFWNNDVLSNRDGVLETILGALQEHKD